MPAEAGLSSYAAGARFASPQNTPCQVYDKEVLKTERMGLETLLDLVAIFTTLMPNERTAIAEKLKQGSYDQGETLVEAGTVLQSLFIVGAGVLSATRTDSGAETKLLRPGPGDHFGEIGLLTGAPSSAKITALAPSIVYELAKQDFAPILEARRQFAQELSRALAQRQAAGRAVAAAELEKTARAASLGYWFSERIHKLFELSTTK